MKYAVRNRHLDIYQTLSPKNPSARLEQPVTSICPFQDGIIKWWTALARGADPNIPDSCGSTALHGAAAAGHHDIVETLLIFGADPNLKCANGPTALQFCSSQRSSQCIQKTLLPKTHQPDWNSLLPEFSRFGWKDQVEAALLNGADPNITDVWYSPPLHLAAASGHRDIVKILLYNGSDPKLKDWDKRTAWQCARPKVIEEVILNFMSVPHSLQFYCRASIRGRLIKCLPDNGLPIEQAVKKLPLTIPMKWYVHRLPLSSVERAGASPTGLWCP